jgi:hypothetical protein
VRFRLIFLVFVLVVGGAATAAALGERSPHAATAAAVHARAEDGPAPTDPTDPITITRALPPTTTTTVIPASRTVFIVGDSLTVDALPFLPTTLGQVGWAASGIDAEHGRRTAEGLAVLASHPDLPPTVLVALGTNDLDATAEQIDDWVHQARVAVGNRRLIWVNLQLGDKPPFAGYPAINAALAAAGAKYKVQVVDWAAWSAAHSVQHLGDGIHYGLAGSALRAGFYAEMLLKGT